MSYTLKKFTRQKIKKQNKSSTPIPNSQSNLRCRIFQHPTMASMAFASVFSASLHNLANGKLQSTSSSASMAFLDLYTRANLSSSKSKCFGTRLSALVPILPALPSNSRHFASINARAATGKTIYDFTVKDIDGKDVSLSKFKDRVLLIVNVASQCGLTSSNYRELTHLYQKYKPQGLEILAFPCNQFGGQEPGSNPQIKEFACTRYKAEFPIFDKVDVNGPSTAPVYQFLKSNAGGFLGDLVKWNFEKFLVGKNGKVVERYPPTTSPFQIEKDIKRLLAA